MSHTASPWHGRNSRAAAAPSSSTTTTAAQPFAGKPAPTLRVIDRGIDADLRDTEASNDVPPDTGAVPPSQSSPMARYRAPKPAAQVQIDASNYRAGYRAGWRQGKVDRITTALWAFAFGAGCSLALVAAGAKLV